MFYSSVFLVLGGIGYIILIVSRSAALSYFAVYMATCGIYPVIRKCFVQISLWYTDPTINHIQLIQCEFRVLVVSANRSEAR